MSDSTDWFRSYEDVRLIRILATSQLAWILTKRWLIWWFTVEWAVFFLRVWIPLIIHYTKNVQYWTKINILNVFSGGDSLVEYLTFFKHSSCIKLLFLVLSPSFLSRALHTGECITQRWANICENHDQSLDSCLSDHMKTGTHNNATN